MTHHTEEERKKNEARVDQAKVGNKVVDEPADAETQVTGTQDFPNVQGEKDPATTVHTNQPQQTYTSTAADPYARQRQEDIDRNNAIPGYQTPDTYAQTDAEKYGVQQPEPQQPVQNPNADPYARQRAEDVDRSRQIPGFQTPDTYAQTDKEKYGDPATTGAGNQNQVTNTPQYPEQVPNTENPNVNQDPYAQQRASDVDRSKFIPNKQTPDTYRQTDAELAAQQAQQSNQGEAATTESADAAAQQRDETGQGTNRLKITKEEKSSENQ
jgi:hypothetical protein